MADETTEAAFDRGQVAGAIAQQLRAHDKHFADINGSVARTATELETLRLDLTRGLADLRGDVQSLAQDARASQATVIATAEALKAADDARRNVAETRWSPFAKGIAAVSGAAALVALLAWVVQTWPQ